MSRRASAFTIHGTGMAMDRALDAWGLAIDRAPENRTIDADGRLHIRMNNIGKANVCPYMGEEIPDWEALGLDPKRVYMLYRDPDALAASESLWNNIPLLDKHVPISADEPMKDHVVGSTGTDAAWSEPYMTNSLVVWDAGAIAGVDSKKQAELSPAYRYTAIMEPGVVDGIAYDGKMVDIIPNHVCLVEAGRAGPDVVVGDSGVTMKLNTKRGLMLQGALRSYLHPRLAKDSKIELTDTICAGTPKQIADRVTAAAKPKLAQDAEMDVGDVVAIIDAMQAVEGDDLDAELATDEDDEETEEEKKKRLAADSDDDDDKKDDKVDKPAMDAAIAAAVRDAEARTVARMNGIREAEDLVRPHIGTVLAQDSAESVYKLALDKANVDLTDVPPAAFKALVKMLPKPGEQAPTRHAFDAGAAKTARDRVNARIGLN